MSPNSEAQSLDSLFNARSIAIVGISAEPTKIGSVIYKNLVEGGYSGKIFLINPKYQQLFELPCYPSLGAVQEEIDTACIAIPAQFVEQVVVEAAEKKIKNLVIITAGFGEKGKEGKAMEQEIALLAKNSDMRILGPNCLGFMSLHNKINLSFAATSPEVGNIALISQSGAICTAILDIAEKDNAGFSHVISVGNKSDLTENELLPYLLNDPNTSVIGAYLESLAHGQQLLSLYNQARNAKPLVVIKPGSSVAGQHAIGSHTGAATSSQTTLITALQQRGAVYSDNLEEFSLLLQCFSGCNPLLGDHTAIVTNAGGPGILATDALIASGLTLHTPSAELQAALSVVLPSEASVQNPFDVLGDAQADRFKEVLSLLSKDSSIHGILVILTPQYVTEIEKTCEVIVAISQQSNKTVIPVLLGNYMVEKGKEVFRAARLPYATEIQTAVAVLNKMCRYEQAKVTLPATTQLISEPLVVAGKSAIVSTQETIALLNAYNIPQVEQLLAEDLQAALNWATTRYPVVLKVATEVSAHKTDVKGVFLNIAHDELLKDAWKQLRANFPGNAPLLLQKQLSYEEEFFLGATTDPSFGRLMVFGKGGVFTKEYNDYGRVVLPASREQLLEALATTVISKILVGARGKEPLPVSQLVGVIEKFQQLLLEHPEIQELDANPILITPHSVHAVDVKFYSKSSPG